MVICASFQIQPCLYSCIESAKEHWLQYHIQLKILLCIYNYTKMHFTLTDSHGSLDNNEKIIIVL